MKQHIALLGDGAWGTAVATVLAHNGHAVKIWCYNRELVEQINSKHVNNKYLPGITLSPLITASHDLKEVVTNASIIFQAIPVKYLRATLAPIRDQVSKNIGLVSLSKGIEQETLALPTQIIQEIFGAQHPVAAVSGPSFARDVAHQQPVAMVVAAQQQKFADQISGLLANNYITIELSQDLAGVQAVGALKNVIALAAGIAEGAGYSESTRACIVTKGMQELAIVANAVGAQRETVYGLAGLGDLILTSYSGQSRNLQVGKRLGQGQSLENILAQTGYTPEGINTLRSVTQLAQKHKLSLPLCQVLSAVVAGTKKVPEFIKNSMQ